MIESVFDRTVLAGRFVFALAVGFILVDANAYQVVGWGLLSLIVFFIGNLLFEGVRTRTEFPWWTRSE